MVINQKCARYIKNDIRIQIIYGISGLVPFLLFCLLCLEYLEEPYKVYLNDCRNKDTDIQGQTKIDLEKKTEKTQPKIYEITKDVYWRFLNVIVEIISIS